LPFLKKIPQGNLCVLPADLLLHKLRVAARWWMNTMNFGCLVEVSAEILNKKSEMSKLAGPRSEFEKMTALKPLMLAVRKSGSHSPFVIFIKLLTIDNSKLHD
jgi:hypothetical protein